MSKSSEDVMRSMVCMFATGDVASVVEVVADEYHDHQGLSGTEIHGPEGFRLVVETARHSIRGLSVTIEDLIADGDRVAARIRWQGHSPSGDPVDRETIDIVHVRSGRAVEHWGAQL
jgi:predicted ester cyclase